jgi:hypothetical protein
LAARFLLATKVARLNKDLNEGSMLKLDTIIDLINYAIYVFILAEEEQLG